MQLNSQPGEKLVVQVGSQKSLNVSYGKSQFNSNSGPDAKFIITNTPQKTHSLCSLQQIFSGARTGMEKIDPNRHL